MNRLVGVQIGDRHGPWLTGLGLMAALAQVGLGLAGTVVAVGCAVALVVRRNALAGMAVVAVAAVVLMAFLMAVIPANVELVRV